MLTFTLTDTGYVVHLNGEVWVECPFDPAQGGFTPFASDEAKRAHAKEAFPEASEL